MYFKIYCVNACDPLLRVLRCSGLWSSSFHGFLFISHREFCVFLFANRDTKKIAVARSALKFIWSDFCRSTDDVHNIFFGFRHNKNARPKNSSTWFTVRNSFLRSFFYLFFASIIIMRPIGRSYNNRRQVNTVEMMSNTNTNQWRGNNARSRGSIYAMNLSERFRCDLMINAKHTYTSHSNQSWAEITTFRIETLGICLGAVFSHIFVIDFAAYLTFTFGVSVSVFQRARCCLIQFCVDKNFYQSGKMAQSLSQVLFVHTFLSF